MSNPSRFNWFFRPHLPDEDMPLSAELRFAEALAELPAIERSALALSEIGGLGTEEIAQRLGTDAIVVRKLLARARETVRTTISVRGRRGLTALFPFQSWWSSGSTAPVVRTAGAVAAAVIGTGVAIGGASADLPQPVLVSPDPPVVRSLGRPQDRLIPARVVSGTVPRQQPQQLQQAEQDKAGPAAVRPEGERYGDFGAAPAETAGRTRQAPVRRGDEPVIGARPAPPPAQGPGSPGPPSAAPPQPVPPPFPTPYPVPIPVPDPVPSPAPLPPVELPVDPPALPPAPPLPLPLPLP